MKKTVFTFALCLGMIYTSQAQTKIVASKSCNVAGFNDHWLFKSYNTFTKPTLSKNVAGLTPVHETGDIIKKGLIQMPIEFKTGKKENIKKPGC